MYFPDLSPYSFLGKEGKAALNVGWLDEYHDYDAAPVSETAMKRLAFLCANPVNQTRGYHKCPFCAPGQGHPTQEQLVDDNDEQTTLGSAEVRVVAGDGTVFAAPDLVVHYVRRHGYKPLDAFLDALEARSGEELLTCQTELDEY